MDCTLYRLLLDGDRFKDLVVMMMVVVFIVLGVHRHAVLFVCGRHGLVRLCCLIGCWLQV